jgi:radical SAM protein with 4Fe4S-binding SPASM domain
MMPREAVLAVTYRCNARCAMCGIWNSKPVAELLPAAYSRLPSSLRDVNLTGGEPFLRDDLPEIHAAVRSTCRRVRTIVSTNGLLTDRIVAAVRAMASVEPGIGVAVSVDGPPEIHDRMRGVPGAHERAMATIRALQQAGFRNLRLAFTATRENANCLGQVYALSRELGAEFTCAAQHGSEHYFQVRAPQAWSLQAEIAPAIRGELRSLSPKRWARAYFMNGLSRFAAGRGRPLPCRAGRDFFFMSPSGDVFTCNVEAFRMGNLSWQSFAQIWNSLEASNARVCADMCRGGCWMVCTARTALRRAWLRVLLWGLVHSVVGVRNGGEPP